MITQSVVSLLHIFMRYSNTYVADHEIISLPFSTFVSSLFYFNVRGLLITAPSIPLPLPPSLPPSIHPSQLLEHLTDSLTKTSNNFSTETINVRLSSPDVPDLTVVDLPGIIRTSTAGQDPTVIAQVCVVYALLLL